MPLHRHSALYLCFLALLCTSGVWGALFSPSQLLERYDTNGDRSLNSEEFAEAFLGLFDAEHDHEHTHSHGHEEDEHSEIQLTTTTGDIANCFTPDLLFSSADMNGNNLLSSNELANLTASLIVMIAEGCQVSHPSECPESNGVEAWLGGIGASLFISIVALVAVALLPFKAESFQRIVLPLLIALAVGTLVGDALLHLIPAAIGAHSHDHEESAEEEGEFDSLGPLSMALLSAFIFFVLEQQLGRFHTHFHSGGEEEEEKHDSKAEDEEKSTSKEPATSSEQKADEETPSSSAADKMAVMNVEESRPKKKKAAGYMNLIADGLHNFTDGLALGAAFSESWVTGLSTLLAVFLHEVPQEFGDFAILIRSGWTRRGALLANFFSALTCILGTIIGLAAGENKKANKYLLGLAAGTFLYLGLANMVVELHQEKGLRMQIALGGFILLGYALMILMTYLEEIIQFC